jgi:isoamylase
MIVINLFCDWRNMEQYRMEPGRVYPIGSTVDDFGVNFALFSAHAEKVELCIFDEQGDQELKRFVLPMCEHNIWPSLWLSGLRTL